MLMLRIIITFIDFISNDLNQDIYKKRGNDETIVKLLYTIYMHP